MITDAADPCIIDHIVEKARILVDHALPVLRASIEFVQELA